MPPRATAPFGGAGNLLAAGAAIIGALTADKRNADLIEFATQGGAALLSLRYGREHELEADHYGIDYMVRAGYDPQAAVELQETFVRLSGNKSAELAGRAVRHPSTFAGTGRGQSRACRGCRQAFRGEDDLPPEDRLPDESKPAYLAHDEGRKLLEKEPAQALAKAEQAHQARSARRRFSMRCAAMR
jgi:hypothetical protein